MKIFVISSSALPAPAPDYSGLEQLCANFAVKAAGMGHNVVMATVKGSTLEGNWKIDRGESNEPGSLSVFCTGDASWSGMSEKYHYEGYKDILEKEFGDGQGVVWDSTWLSYSYLSASALPNMKIVHTHHGMLGYRSSPPVTFPRFVGLSRAHAHYISSYLNIPCRYVHNGIPLPPENEVQTQNGEYLLSLNRITDEKGIHDSIDIAVQNKIPIIVAGDDTHVISQQYVQRIIDRCRKSNGLAKYYGLVDNNTKIELIKGCKATIGCPKPSWMEGFGLWAVESLSYGRPCLALANGGLMDIIEHGKSGFLASTPSKLSEFVSQVDSLEPQACRARAQVFNLDNMVNSYLDLFDKVSQGDPTSYW